VIKQQSKWVHHYNHNKFGKDYIVGDIHGCYDELMVALDAINFNKETDRLFCVGDLVDRGTDNMKSTELLDEPWYFQVMGNHEAMHIESFYSYSEANGTKWALEILASETNPDKEKLLDYIKKTESLPYAIIIDDEDGDIHSVIMHAELPFPVLNSDEEISFDLLNENGDVRYFTDVYPRECSIIWGRYLMYSDTWMHGTKWVFHGHTIVSQPIKSANRVYIDTGFVLGNLRKESGIGMITIVDIQDELVHQISVDFSAGLVHNHAIEPIDQLKGYHQKEDM
jgi:serine/threonine protein phosphatase 1